LTTDYLPTVSAAHWPSSSLKLSDLAAAVVVTEALAALSNSTPFFVGTAASAPRKGVVELEDSTGTMEAARGGQGFSELVSATQRAVEGGENFRERRLMKEEGPQSAPRPKGDRSACSEHAGGYWNMITVRSHASHILNVINRSYLNSKLSMHLLIGILSFSSICNEAGCFAY
jgi:hypothetical protein